MDETRHGHVESGEILEAEAVYVEAAKELEQQMTVKNTDAIILSWCRCRGELGKVQFNLLKIPEAKASLTTAMAYLQRVIPLRPKEPAFRFEVAKIHSFFSQGYSHLLRCIEAEAHQREAVELLKKLSLDYPGRADYRLELSKWHVSHGNLLKFLGRYQEAEACHKESIRLAEKLVADGPKSPEYAQQLALTYSSYAVLALESRRDADAIALNRMSIRILAKMEADYPDQPEYWFQLPAFNRKLAQLTQGEIFANAAASAIAYESEVATAQREATRLEAKLARLPETARKWENDLFKIQGSLLNRDMQQFLSHQKVVEKVSKQAEKNTRSDPSSPYAQWGAAVTQIYRGMQLVGRGMKDEGMKECGEALAKTQKLAEKYPDIPIVRMAHSDMYFGYSLLHFIGADDAGRNEGYKMILQWLALSEKLADDHPKVPGFRCQIADKVLEVGEAFGKENKFEETSRYMKIEHDVLKKLATDFPSCPKYRQRYAESIAGRAICLHMMKEDAGAEAANREGIQQWQKMIADFPGVTDYHHILARIHQEAGVLFNVQKKYQQAENAFQETIRIEEQLLKENRKDPLLHLELSRAYRSIGLMQERQNRDGHAIKSYSKALNAAETGFNLNPRQRSWLAERRWCITMQADLHLRLGKHAEYNGDIQRLKELDETLDTPFLRLYRIDDRAKKGEIAVAMKEADDLFHNIDLTDTQWRDLAAFYTDMAAKATDATQKEALAVRAVASLQNAVQQGYSRAGLTDDVRFRTLVDRGDFRKLTLTK